MIDTTDKKNVLYASFYFTLSTLITYWFIESAPVYTSLAQKMTSCGIAGIKWAIQIIFALVFLQGKKWNFIRNIGFTAFLGSLLLVPFSVSSFFGINVDSVFFVCSLIVSVLVMVFSYLISVKKSNVPSLWWAGWLFCLAIAITIQLKLVFNIWIF